MPAINFFPFHQEDQWPFSAVRIAIRVIGVGILDTTCYASMLEPRIRYNIFSYSKCPRAARRDLPPTTTLEGYQLFVLYINAFQTCSDFYRGLATTKHDPSCIGSDYAIAPYANTYVTALHPLTMSAIGICHQEELAHDMLATFEEDRTK